MPTSEGPGSARMSRENWIVVRTMRKGSRPVAPGRTEDRGPRTEGFRLTRAPPGFAASGPGGRHGARRRRRHADAEAQYGTGRRDRGDEDRAVLPRQPLDGGGH